MNAKIRNQMQARKRRIEKRLDKTKFGSKCPVISVSNIHYEIAEMYCSGWTLSFPDPRFRIEPFAGGTGGDIGLGRCEERAGCGLSRRLLPLRFWPKR